MPYKRLKIKNKNCKGKIFKLLAVAFSFNILFFILLPKQIGLTHAQSYSLSISPSLLEVVIKPGKTVTQEFKITNHGDEVITTPQIRPLKLDPSTGNPRISYSEKLDPQMESLFSLTNPDLKLGEPLFLRKNETKQLLLRIAIPENTDNGDHYLLFALTSEEPPDESRSLSRIETTVGANILTTISTLGTLNKTGVIEDIQFPILIDSFDRLEGKINIKNTGSAFFKPLGKITLSSPLLNAEYPILPQNILSGTTRVIKTTLDLTSQSIAPNEKTISLTGFFLGPYTFTAQIKPDGTDLNLKKSIRVLALPWKALLIVSLLFLIIYYFKKKKSS